MLFYSLINKVRVDRVQKSLMEFLAIPLNSQNALHSHSAKSRQCSDNSYVFRAAKWLRNQMTNRLTFTMLNRRIDAVRLVRHALLIVGLLLSSTVSAVGLGGINVISALGQQLKADIELVAITKAEKDSLVARLASPEAYKNAGLEYPYNNKFKFHVETRADGKLYIKASSGQPVNDPFVSLLVELSWSSGKLSREYTFLLDPPGYVSEQPAQPTVQAVVPEVQATTPVAPEAQTAVPEQVITPEAPAPEVTPSAPIVAEQQASEPVEQAASAVIPEQQTAPTEAVTPTENIVPAEPEKTVTPSLQTAPETAVVQNNKEWVAVHRGDTLYKIAEQYKLTDMSVERMLVAMYHTNADQFDGRNMNRIKVGKILHLPTAEEISSVSLPEAVKEIHAQTANWNAYRQKLAKAAGLGKPSIPSQQVATGKIGSSVTEETPVAKESAKEVLKLSKGEAPQDKTGASAGGQPMSAQDKKNAAQEEAVAQSKAAKEAQNRTALLEKNLQDMQRLAELKAQLNAVKVPLKTEAAALPKTVETPPAQSGATAATSAVKPAPIISPKSKPVNPEPSLADQILEEPLYLAAVAGALLVLGGVAFLMYRRKKNRLNRNEITTDFIDVGSTSSRITPPVIPSPDTGDFTQLSAPPAVNPLLSDDVDPISEADLFLNFGRDVQAEAILKEALLHHPDNHLISLKLLGIYVNRKDTNAFATIARRLQESGDAEAWQQAAAMGRKLEPNNPMYSGGAIEDATSATMQMSAFDVVSPATPPKAAAVDFDLDVSATTAKYASSPEQDFLSTGNTSILPAGNGHFSPDAEMDFDITSNQDSPQQGRVDSMDFDITATNPSVPVVSGSKASSSAMMDEMVFDVTTTSHTHITATPQFQPKPAKDDDGGMTFMLDFPVDVSAEKSEPITQTGNLSSINLNFDNVNVPAETPSETRDDQWQEVATKLDLAKAYQEMGDASGAREILEEVLREGNTEQREAAQTIIQQLG
jgi:pilus assembly protein FimV